ncbi:MAG: DUF2203 domain-containing protein [Polyangiaceae bacterium]|jgi:hypothetical protein|nr:DUF2203 domain-containing protein [Polyangiaceae bacterium]
MGPPFSLDEADALVPRLHRIVSRQLLAQRELEEVLEKLHTLLGQLPRELAILGDESDEVRALKEAAGRLMDEVDAGWCQVQELGGQVKDPRVGLVDMPGLLEGRPVLFCWRFGEEHIAHYHELDEGFSARKPLPSRPRHRLFN